MDTPYNAMVMADAKTLRIFDHGTQRIVYVSGLPEHGTHAERLRSALKRSRYEVVDSALIVSVPHNGDYVWAATIRPKTVTVL